MANMVKTAVLVSGGGTNMQSILDAHIFGEIPNCELTAVISSDSEAYALTRAQNAHIPTYVVDAGLFPNNTSFCSAILDKLKDLDIELVVLAGFVHRLGQALIKQYTNRIIDVYPTLLPSFRTDGGYGLRPHEMVLEYGAKVSGATAYFVTEELADGPVILQQAVDVREDDTPKTLQQRVMEEAEWKILPRAIALYCSGKLSVEGRVVRILSGENSRK